MKKYNVRMKLMPQKLLDVDMDIKSNNHSHNMKQSNESNIDVLTNQLKSIDLKDMAKQAKKKKKTVYIDTSKLLKFSR